jgi:DNA-binding NtrC family response regulator
MSTPPEQRLLMLIENEVALSHLITAMASRAGWGSIVIQDSETALATLGTAEGEALSAVILDQDVAGDATCDLISELTRRRPQLPVLLLATGSSASLPVEAVRAGASDYLTKPVAPGRLLQSLRLISSGDTPAELLPLADKLAADAEFVSLIGAAPAFRAAVAKAAMAARGQGSVLIEGEGGTGKDMLMRAVQAASPRARLPFRVINLRSVAPGDLGSVLFGHEKGAVTESGERHVGAFEQCDGGTLALDEINRLPRDMQERLADALLRGRIQPMGAHYGFRVDVRIIAGSNQPLSEMVEAGVFDRQLYEVLSGATITLPPLRERLGDLPALARYFIGRIREQFGLPDLGLTDDAVTLLSSYNWPGNVRQLQAVLLRAAALCRGQALTAADFPHLAEMAREADRSNVSAQPLAHAGVALFREDGNLRRLDEIEGDVVRLAIGHYQGRMSEVARRLQIGRSTLYRKLSELGLESLPTAH